MYVCMYVCVCVCHSHPGTSAISFPGISAIPISDTSAIAIRIQGYEMVNGPGTIFITY